MNCFCFFNYLSHGARKSEEVGNLTKTKYKSELKFKKKKKNCKTYFSRMVDVVRFQYIVASDHLRTSKKKKITICDGCSVSLNFLLNIVKSV